MKGRLDMKYFQYAAMMYGISDAFTSSAFYSKQDITDLVKTKKVQRGKRKKKKKRKR